MENENENNLLDQINQFKKQYYTENSKNVLFKNSQKKDCAKQISGKFDLHEMLKITFFIIPNTPIIFIDYTKFKLFANEDIYNDIIVYILGLFDICIKDYGKYSVHLNMDTLTISALERHKKLLELHSNICIKLDKNYSNLIDSFIIYNPANAIEMFYKVIRNVLPDNVKNKINIISKIESEKQINLLFS